MQTQMTDIDMQESDTSDRILKKNTINKKKIDVQESDTIVSL